MSLGISNHSQLCHRNHFRPVYDHNQMVTFASQSNQNPKHRRDNQLLDPTTCYLVLLAIDKFPMSWNPYGLPSLSRRRRFLPNLSPTQESGVMFSSVYFRLSFRIEIFSVFVEIPISKPLMSSTNESKFSGIALFFHSANRMTSSEANVQSELTP